ncbi:MAG: DUF5687 family protein [Oscillospiraceae bacterium]|nr:DUF5687 family protein [Oscillospiraceae bacterium]
MKIHNIFYLEWKSFTRHPFFEQIIIFNFVKGVYLLFLLSFIYFSGLLLNQFTDFLLGKINNLLMLTLFLFFVTFLLDFILKFFFKQSDLNFSNFLRFPNSKKSIFVYSIVKEVFSFWSIYLVIFFFPFLKSNLYSQYGLGLMILTILCLFFVEIQISLWVNKIKGNETAHGLKIYVTSNRIFPRNEIVSYIMLNINMIIRSPFLRRQFITCLILCSGSFFLLTKQDLMQVFSAKILILCMYYGFFPFIFNQFLFSAEASFFDQLMITPNFKEILPAKFLSYVFFSSLLFFVSLFIIPFSSHSFIESLAIFSYTVGFITLFSFCSILFVDTKIDLFGSRSKAFVSTQSTQALVILLVGVISIGLVGIISWLFSSQLTIYFMMILGGISFFLHKKWLSYLFRCFLANKYKKMEIFRIL